MLRRLVVSAFLFAFSATASAGEVLVARGGVHFDAREPGWVRTVSIPRHPSAVRIVLQIDGLQQRTFTYESPSPLVWGTLGPIQDSFALHPQPSTSTDPLILAHTQPVDLVRFAGPLQVTHVLGHASATVSIVDEAILQDLFRGTGTVDLLATGLALDMTFSCTDPCKLAYRTPQDLDVRFFVFADDGSGKPAPLL